MNNNYYYIKMMKYVKSIIIANPCSLVYTTFMDNLANGERRKRGR